MKPVLGHDGYFIDECGQLYSNKRGTLKAVNARIGQDGYPFVMMYTNGKRIWERTHRLVAIAYIPNPDDLPCVCHKDDDRSNPHVDNLFWGTHKDNTQDMVGKGRNGFNVGMESNGAKLTDDQVREIRNRHVPRKVPARLLASEYGVHENTILDILTRKTWKHVA